MTSRDKTLLSWMAAVVVVFMAWALGAVGVFTPDDSMIASLLFGSGMFVACRVMLAFAR